MNMATEKNIIELDGISEVGQNEIIDFINFIREKEHSQLVKMINDSITENEEAFRELAK